MNAPDMSVDFCGIKFKNPVVTASGTYGFGREYNEFVPLSKLGGISVKGLTLLPRDGNKPPRIAETPSGILNSVGLQNPGIHAFIEKELPFLKKQNLAIIANISGNTVEDYMEMTEIASDSDVDLLEINISCPNVKSGGMAFGTSTSSVEQITRAVKSKAKKPVMIKLSPNVTDIAEIARAAEAAGARGQTAADYLGDDGHDENGDGQPKGVAHHPEGHRPVLPGQLPGEDPGGSRVGEHPLRIGEANAQPGLQSFGYRRRGGIAQLEEDVGQFLPGPLPPGFGGKKLFACNAAAVCEKLS